MHLNLLILTCAKICDPIAQNSNNMLPFLIYLGWWLTGLYSSFIFLGADGTAYLLRKQWWISGKSRSWPFRVSTDKRLGFQDQQRNPGPENKSQVCDQQATSFYLLLLASSRRDFETQPRSKYSLYSILICLITLYMTYSFHTLVSLPTCCLSQTKTEVFRD